MHPLLVWLLSVWQVAPAWGCDPSVLLISADGFRWDYLNEVDTPNILSMRATGVWATEMVNAFVTKTFPNHWTLVTGVYEETHGIVGNGMFDPETNSSFNFSTCGSWWDAVEPLWATLERSGRPSASYAWPGSNCPIHGVLPRDVVPFAQSAAFSQRVDTVLGWLRRDCATRPALVTLYFQEPDSTGHTYGPNSSEVRSAVRDIDRLVGRLLAEIAAGGLGLEVNVVLTSDHGMAETSPDRVVYLEDFVPSDWYTAVNQGPIAALWPRDGVAVEAVYLAIAGRLPNATVYRKQDLPERWHYRHHPRVMPIIVVADEGWLVLQTRGAWIGKGNHGYDNRLRSMHPLFLASGPAFQVGRQVPTFRNVDVYPLLCEVLRAPCHAHNGSLEVAWSMLRSPAPDSPAPSPPAPASGGSAGAGWGVVLLCLGGALAASVVAFLVWRTHRHQEPAPGGTGFATLPAGSDDHATPVDVDVDVDPV
eukprot:EG_transcript_11046